jgi:hypothetical protein
MSSKSKLPTIKKLSALFRALKPQIADEYRCSDDPDDTTPGMCVTIGCSPDGSWSYQTGDNSFTGGAYGHPDWAVVYLCRRSDSRALAREAIDQIAELRAY